MKVIALFANLLFVGSMVCSAKDIKPVGDAVAIVKAEELISQKKYLSAYKMLDKYDPRNEKSVIFLKKVDIVQNYFLFNIMNQIFCLDDIPLDKTVEELRGNEEASGCSSVMFAIDTIAEMLLLKEPSNAQLYRCLADFYVSVARRFGDQWIEPTTQADLMARARVYYLKANNLGLNNNEITANIAESYLHQENYRNARRYYANAIALSADTIANYHYNTALAYYLDPDSGDFALAAKHSSIAARHYTQGSDYQYDALYIAGMSQMRMGQPSVAIANFRKANAISPNRNYLLFSTIEAQLKAKAQDWRTTTETYIVLFANNTDLTSRLPELFAQTDSTKLNELKNLFAERMKKTSVELEIANLNLATAQICMYGDNKSEARSYLLKAKDFFARDTDEYDSILGYINQLLKHAK